MLLITSLEAWQAPGDRFTLADGQAAWAMDDTSALAVADDVFPQGQVVAVTLDPEPTRIPPPGVVAREQAARVRFLRRGPAGRHTAVLARPDTAAVLDLLPHPEGGWYRETWRPASRFHPDGYPGERHAASGIYFLLPPGEESVWHAVRSDEVWLWHAGGPLTLLLGGDGDRPEPAGAREIALGGDVRHGQIPQAVVRAGHWQAAKPATGTEVLVSCVVAPGFDFADFRV